MVIDIKQKNLLSKKFLKQYRLPRFKHLSTHEKVTLYNGLYQFVFTVLSTSIKAVN